MRVILSSSTQELQPLPRVHWASVCACLKRKTGLGSPNSKHAMGCDGACRRDCLYVHVYWYWLCYGAHHCPRDQVRPHNVTQTRTLERSSPAAMRRCPQWGRSHMRHPQ
jgi:hypothetical protein